MRNVYIILVLIVFSATLKAQSVDIMLITGGHSFDTTRFFQLFDRMPNIKYEHFQQPEANSAIAKGKAKEFDVLVFYDMWQSVSDSEKQAYINLTKKGKPMLFLHHSLVSYQDWPEFEKLIGGKYIQKNPAIPEDEQSTYEHDVWVYMHAMRNHPVTKGFKMIKLFDEVYGNTRISDDVLPLFKTNHPKSSRVIGWENKFNSSRIVYLQPGHDYRAYESEDYRQLLEQTIKYLAGINQ